MERLWPLAPFTSKRVGQPGRGGRDRVAQAKGAFALLALSGRLPLRVLRASRSGQQDAWSRCPPRLQQPLLDFHQAAIGAGFRPDNKRTAFMWRPGGALVVADPFVPP